MPDLSIAHGDGHNKWVMHGPWRPGHAQLMRESGVFSLELNETKGFVGDDLDFLVEVPELRELEVIHHHLKDDSGVTHCKSLRRLVLNTYARSSPDFAQLKDLEDCYLEWREAAQSIYRSPQVKRLRIQSYPEVDLTTLALLDRLTALSIGAASKLRDLTGIMELRRLEFLGLYAARRLYTLEGIESLHRLEVLEIQECKRVASLEPVRELTELRRLLFAESGPIPSLAPLDRLPRLEEFLFYGSTRVDDGLIRRLLELQLLRKVAYQNRSHYDISREEFAEILEKRR